MLFVYIYVVNTEECYLCVLYVINFGDAFFFHFYEVMICIYVNYLLFTDKINYCCTRAGSSLPK